MDLKKDNIRKQVDDMLENYYSKYDLYLYERDIKRLELEDISTEEKQNRLNSIFLLKYTAEFRNHILFNVLRNLSKSYQKIFELRYKDKLTNKEISIKVSISNRTVCNIISYVIHQNIVPNLDKYELL